MDTEIENARRVVHWIDMAKDDQTFTRKDIFNSLNAISRHPAVPMSVIDDVLDQQVLSGKIKLDYDMSNLKRTVLRKVKKVNDVEKRLSDLEIKYKWLESVVAKAHVPEKQRLWSADEPIPREVEYIDVMYTDGRIVENFYIGTMPLIGSDILAWRKTA